MCIYCRNRNHQKQTIITTNHIKHSRLSQSETVSQSSFSSTSSSYSPSLCSKHKHTITHKIHFPTQQLYSKPNDNNLYKTTGFISPKRYQKVGGVPSNIQIPPVNPTETEYYQYQKVSNNNEVIELKRELNQKNRRIEDLLSQNRRLVNELRNQKEYSGNQIEQFIYELRNSKQDGNPLLSRQNKKIQLLLSEFQRLKNQNGEKFKEVKKQIHRMRSVDSNDRIIGKESKPFVDKSRERVKEVVIEEERCLRWKNNFINSFLDMMQKIAAKQGVELNKKLDSKRRVKNAWRYMKRIFKQQWSQ